MKIKYPDEIKKAFIILGIVLIVCSFIFIILSGVFQSRFHKEDTITVMGDRSVAFGINVDRGQTAHIKYEVVNGLDTIRIIIQIEYFNGDVINLTETNGREIKFNSNETHNYLFRFLNYGNESSTIHYDLFISAHKEIIEYFYLSIVCFILGVILIITFFLKRKNMNKKHKHQ